MAIKTGRFGNVLWDPLGGAAAVPIVSLNAWTLDETMDMEDVTCFGDTNKVYVPGMKDTKGTIGGFSNAADPTLWKAADAGTPGTLVLLPNTQEPAYKFSGLAYLNASMDCSLSAPKLTGTWAAAGPWTTPGSIAATGATAGTPGTFTPAGAVQPANLAALTGITASPASAWTVGQYVKTADNVSQHWSGTAWVTGVA